MSLPTPAPAARSPWFRIHRPRPAAAQRLLCLPHAGGSASFYRTWPDAVPDGIEVVAVQYPGREDRIADPFPGSMPVLADALAEAVLRGVRPPYALFGHSLGAAIAYEVAHRLVAQGASPTHVFASGRHAPQQVRDEHVHLRDDDGLMAELGRLGGTPPELLADPGVREVVLPTLRHDYRLAETYRPVPRKPLPCPVSAIVGDADPEVTPDEAGDWAAVTSGAFDLTVLPGDHFHLVPNRDRVTALVAGRLARYGWPSTP